MNDETALLAAITAHPGEDTPRLAYADWLDENEAPIQADFVRTQCQLAAGSAADPDYPDLVERSAELAAQFGPFAQFTVPKLPDGFACEHALDRDADHFRRGFLYTVEGEWNGFGTPDGADTAADRVCAGLPQLIETTTARHLRLHHFRSEAVARILAAPGAEALTGLSIQPGDWGAGSETVVRALIGTRVGPNLERLALYAYVGAAAFAELAAARFDRLAHLELPMLYGRARDLQPLLAAPWFRRLRSVRAGSADRAIEGAVLDALARLPHLDALDVRFQSADTADALGAARGFRELSRLTYWLPHAGAAGAERLAKGAFPRLAELDLWSARSAHLTALAGAKWLPQLRVLSLRHSRISDKSVVALAKSTAAANLRILQLDNIAVGKTAFAALSDGTRFPNLTTLELSTADARKMTAADLTAFAATLNLPRLRHLNLSGWPLGDAGARALAANPALANLTRLSVGGCGIGEKGLAALVRSRHLRQLIELDVTNNKLTTAAALRDAARLPRLAAARLAGNAIPQAARRKLHAARGMAV